MTAYHPPMAITRPQQSPSDQLLEPPACTAPFSTTAGGHHYLWRGGGPGEEATTIGVYDPYNELWTLRPTNGPTPLGTRYGGCTTVGDDLYTFGGISIGGATSNHLYKLDLGSELFQWTKVEPTNDPSLWPLCKEGCGLVTVDEGSMLACFGGYADGYGGHTNEFHLFDLRKDHVWSSPDLKGHRPPPCAYFSFTKIERHRAVFFGGFKPNRTKVNDLYLFDFRNMEVTKMEPGQGDPWPVVRSFQAACCLNYDEDHPTVLMSGGTDDDSDTLEDMWILDVNAGDWTEVTLPESVKPRQRHSLTATSLGPGLTEALMFGGDLELFSDPIAETTILRFESTAPSPSVAGPSTGKWVLVDVGHNDTRGSKQRLREKWTKIREANYHALSVREPTDQSLRDRVRSLEQQLQNAEQRTRDAERRAAEASRREQATQHRLQGLLEEANHRCQDTERRLSESEHRLQEAQQTSQEAE